MLYGCVVVVMFSISSSFLAFWASIFLMCSVISSPIFIAFCGHVFSHFLQ